MVLQWFMPNLLEQLTLPTDYSQETLYVKRMKETLAALPEEKGDRICVTFKLSRDRHGELLAQAARHGLTVTDLLTLHIDQIVPVLQKAKPIEVPGYKPDGRTQIPAWKRGRRARAATAAG
jgi:hypothetical protein